MVRRVAPLLLGIFAGLAGLGFCQFGGYPPPPRNGSEKSGRDFYKILGVSKDAEDGVIKKAYRKLAKQHHPDVNQDNQEEAAKKFVDIADAHDVLTDPKKRELYDQYGEDGLDPNFQANPFGPGGNRRTFVYRSPFSQDMFFGFDDIPFGGGFGGFGGFGGGGFEGFHGGGGGHENLYDETDVVQVGDPDQFERAMTSDRNNWATLVNFYSPSCAPCRQLKKEYIQLSKSFGNIVTLVAVNCRRHRDLCQMHDVESYPSLRLFFHDGSRPIQYPKDSARTVSGITPWLTANLPSKVVRLTESNIETWLTSNPHLAKAILFTTKQGVPPIFKLVSVQFVTQISLGIVSKMDSAMMKLFKPKNFPSLFHLVDIDNLEGEWLDITHSAEALNLRLSRIVAQKRANAGPYAALSQGLRELTKRTYDSGVCGISDSSTCLILVKFGGSADRTLHESMTALSEKYKSDPMKFVWVDANQQTELIRTFGVSCATGSKCDPCVIAFRPKRGKFAVLQAAAATEPGRVEKFVDSIMESGGTTLSHSIPRKTPLTLLAPLEKRNMYEEEL